MEILFLRINVQILLKKKENTRRIPYAIEVGSLMYVMLYTRLDICFPIGVVSRYQSNPYLKHWTTIKHIIKYMKRTKDYRLVYIGCDLILVGYTDSNFLSGKDSRKSTSIYVFTLGSGSCQLDKCETILCCRLRH